MTTSPIPVLVCLAAFVPATLAQTPDSDHARDNVWAQLRWKELGPVNFGGRIVDLAVHPTRPQVFWAAAASGGLWKTENGGVSFTPQFQDAYSISIGDLAVAPSNGDVLYVGTGEANNQRSSYWGNGVHKSIDGGKTWTHKGLDGSDHVGRIVVHPQNPDVVWVAALGALYSSNFVRGLYKTSDGGKTWTCTKQLGPDTGFVDVALDPVNPDVLFAASYERRRRAWHISEGGEGSRLWKSTDGGETWRQLAGGLPTGTLGRIGVEVFAGDGRIVYATIENLNPVGTLNTAPTTPPAGDAEDKKVPEPDAETLADPVALADFERRVAQAQDPERRPRRELIGGEIYRSDDGGGTWKKTNGSTKIGGSPGYYYGQIRIDPTDANTLYVL
ncbi:MAG: glycosyl hydrolase, partial [Planctomycetes bacterium]|nr:glycosyl hydrolase [Planctomycetota bacterium]